MSKSSSKSAGAYRESRLVESDSTDLCEWTCEGGAEPSVGIDGHPCRYFGERMSVRLPTRWLAVLLFLVGRKIYFFRVKCFLCIFQVFDGVLANNPPKTI